MQREIVEKAVEEYNSLRSPEAVAKLVLFSGDRFTLAFNGPFCQSCGVFDYFEDFIYELRNLSPIEVKIVEVKETDGIFDVVYEVSTNQFRDKDKISN